MLSLRSSLAAALLLLLAAGCTKGEVPMPTKATEAPTPDTPPVATGKVRFGVLPAVEAATVQQLYAPLAAEMSKTLGREVEVVVAKDYNALVSDLVTGKIDCGQVSIFAFVKGAALRLRAGAETHVLAQEQRSDEKRHFGVIAAREKDGVQSIADLKGKKFVFVDEASSSGFYYPRMLLRREGLDPDNLFAETIFAGSHDKAVALIAEGKADAGAISAQSFASAKGLKQVGRTDAIPSDVVVSLSALSEGERQKLTNLLLTAQTNEALAPYLAARGVTGYVPADVREFTSQRSEMLLAGKAKRERKADLAGKGTK